MFWAPEPEKSLVDKLASIPVTTVTAAATILALCFNLGFFTAIGMTFISLFSIQEHLIFALTGAISLFFLSVLSLGVYDLARTKSFRPLRSRVSAFLSGATFSLTATYIYLVYDDAGFATAYFFGVTLVLVIYFPLILHRLEGSFRAFASPLAIVAATFSFGTYYGHSLMYSESQTKLTYALTKKGDRFTIVRVGDTYTIVRTNTDDGTLARAVKTDELEVVGSVGTPFKVLPFVPLF